MKKIHFVFSKYAPKQVCVLMKKITQEGVQVVKALFYPKLSLVLIERSGFWLWASK